MATRTFGRYKMHAYVCGQACVKRASPPISSCDFHTIWIQRPEDCRYAVVSEWDVVEHRDRFIVFDLFEAGVDWGGKGTGKAIEPVPTTMTDDLDAAIMATSLLYDDGG